MPLSRPRSTSARFRNTGTLKIPLGKFFFTIQEIVSLQHDKKCLTTKNSHNLKKIDMKNILIIQICFKYHIFPTLYQYLPLIFSPDYFIIYISISYIFSRVPECLAKDQKQNKKSQVINCTKFSHFLLYPSKQAGPTKMHNTCTPWKGSFQPSSAEKVKNYLLFQQQPFLPRINQLLFQLALVKSMLVGLLSLD